MGQVPSFDDEDRIDEIVRAQPVFPHHPAREIVMAGTAHSPPRVGSKNLHSDPCGRIRWNLKPVNGMPEMSTDQDRELLCLREDSIATDGFVSRFTSLSGGLNPIEALRPGYSPLTGAFSFLDR